MHPSWPRWLVALATLLALIVPLGPLGAADFAGDTTAPVLVGFTATPASADVSTAPATFSVALHVTDELSGVDFQPMGYTLDGSGMSYGVALHRTSGTERDGWWTGTFTIPVGTAAGRYTYEISTHDHAGNFRIYTGQLGAMGFPTGFDIVSANADVTPPELVALEAPATVDVRSGPARIFVQLQVRDLQSPIVQVGASITSPLGDHGGTTGGASPLVSGDQRDGTWSVEINIPRYTRPGRWSLRVGAGDSLGNWLLLEGDELARAGFRSSIDVVSDPDWLPPTIVSVATDRTEVNVHNEDQEITVTVHATDALSGIMTMADGSVGAISGMLTNGPGPILPLFFGAMPRIAGDPRDGVYEVRMRIPRASPTGWRPLDLYARDAVDNIIGPVRAASPVLVYNTPTPPTLLDILPGDGLAIIRWDAPTDERGAPVTSYIITVGSTGMQVEVGASVRSAVVGGLRNGVAETLHVRAVNKAGLSDPSRHGAVVPGRSGYWMLSSSGAVYAFGEAPHLGNAPVGGIQAVRLTPTPSRLGYWIVDAAGHVFTFGDAPYLGGAVGLAPGEKVTSVSATPGGRGYWLFSDRGRVLPFGDAPFLGDMTGTRLAAPVLDSVATPDGRGYYMVAADGGVFTFGTAVFAGSTGAMRLNAPVEALVADPDGTGYLLVASDGGIFAFGAPFLGSMGNRPLNRPVTGMVGSSGGNGYLMVASDGGIFAFGDVPFRGSLGAAPPPSPIVAAATL